MTRYLAIALEVLIIILIVSVPLAFAGTKYWAWTMMEILVALGLIIWFTIGIFERRLSIVKTPLNIILILFLGYVFFQLVPMPAGLTKLFSGSRLAVEVSGSPSAVVTAPSGSVPITINREQTLQSWFRLLAYGGFFFLVVNFTTTRARLGRLLAVALLTGVVVSFLGMLTSSQEYPQVYRNWPTGDQKELPSTLNAREDKLFSSGVGLVRPIREDSQVNWFRFKNLGAPAFGSFPTQNQAGGFMLMLLPVALGVMLACLGTKRATWGTSGGFLHSREGNMLLLSLVVAVILVMGIVISRSRGALLVAGLTLVVMCILAAFTGSILRGIITSVVMAALIIVPVIIVASFDLGQTVREIVNIKTNPLNEERLVIWETSGRIAGDFPLVGTGAGTFDSIYPLYNQGGHQALFAHCDPLQFRVEFGIIGLLLILAALGVYLVTAVLGIIKMRDTFMRRVLIGVLFGSLALMAHSLIDFDFYIPSTALMFTLLAAVTVILSQDRSCRRTEQDFVF